MGLGTGLLIYTQMRSEGGLSIVQWILLISWEEEKRTGKCKERAVTFLKEEYINEQTCTVFSSVFPVKLKSHKVYLNKYFETEIILARWSKLLAVLSLRYSHSEMAMEGFSLIGHCPPRTSGPRTRNVAPLPSVKQTTMETELDNDGYRTACDTTWRHLENISTVMSTSVFLQEKEEIVKIFFKTTTIMASGLICGCETQEQGALQ